MATLATPYQQADEFGIVDALSKTQNLALERFNQQSHQSGRWTYLISNQYRLSTPQQSLMQLPFPDETTLYYWLVKLITARQVGCIVLDSLPLQRYQISLISSLCHQYRVVLVNMENRSSLDDKVIYGPW